MLIQYAEVKPVVAVTTKTANFINSFSEKKKKSSGPGQYKLLIRNVFESGVFSGRKTDCRGWIWAVQRVYIDSIYRRCVWRVLPAIV